MSKEPNHQLVVLPGLGDRTTKLELAGRWFKRRGFDVVVLPVGWNDQSSGFDEKLAVLADKIRQLKETRKALSIIGVSAGGSMAVHLLLTLPDIIDKAVSLSGRLRAGQHGGWYSLDSRSQVSPAFRQSVLILEKRWPEVSQELRLRVLTTSALLGLDELVPADTTKLDEAAHLVAPLPEHGLSSLALLTLFSKPVVDFLKKSE